MEKLKEKHIVGKTKHIQTASGIKFYPFKPNSLDIDIKTNILWNIYDVRTYGQSKLTFLIHI